MFGDLSLSKQVTDYDTARIYFLASFYHHSCLFHWVVLSVPTRPLYAISIWRMATVEILSVQVWAVTIRIPPRPLEGDCTVSGPDIVISVIGRKLHPTQTTETIVGRSGISHKKQSVSMVFVGDIKSIVFCVFCHICKIREYYFQFMVGLVSHLMNDVIS